MNTALTRSVVCWAFSINDLRPTSYILPRSATYTNPRLIAIFSQLCTKSCNILCYYDESAIWKENQIFIPALPPMLTCLVNLHKANHQITSKIIVRFPRNFQLNAAKSTQGPMWLTSLFAAPPRRRLLTFTYGT